MRAFFFIVAFVSFLPVSGCGETDSTSPERASLGDRRGYSLTPLSVGGGQAGDPNYAAGSGATPMTPTDRPRMPSPYDPVLNNRWRPYSGIVGTTGLAPASPPPVYSAPAEAQQEPPTIISAPMPILAAPAYPIPGEIVALQLTPAPDIPPENRPGDATPSQWFEVLRPMDTQLRIGRLSTTCVCVRARAPKRLIPPGERALIEVRTVSRPPVNNVAYGLYVQILEPENVTLDTDVVVRY
ncbi:MAG: hypothetical protein LBE84_04700 [Planctomycetota bacterium]|jgi:hypothetical protein|nr:hypothetical protein [Planctomycetota bacterium]